MARPSKLTPELSAKLCGYIADGNFFETACALVGVHHVTAWRWIRRGDAEIARVAEDHRRAVRAGEERYVAFRNACARAKADAEHEMVAIVRDAARREHDGEYRAALAWLERARPDTWGPRSKVDMRHSGNVALAIAPAKELAEVEAMSDDQIEAYLEGQGAPRRGLPE